MKRILLILILLLLPSVSALEFTQNTTFNTDTIDFHFPPGIELNDFQIINEGIVLNENHRLIFVVEGGVLDVTFQEWTPKDNLIILKSDAPQDITFKITVDGKRKYLESDGEYFIDSIPVDVVPITVSYVDSFNTETNDVVIKTIKKVKWYETKFAVFEYDTKVDNKGILTGKTFGISYLALILFILFIIIGVWLIR